jgi:hypothetical protein
MMTMSHRLRIISCALVSICVTGGIAASAAQALPQMTAAQAGTFKGEEVGKHEWTVGSRAVACEEVEFTGPSATSQVTFTLEKPKHAKCSTTPILGVTLKATMTWNGCDLLFHLTAAFPAFSASVDLVCPAGKVAELHLYSDAAHAVLVCTVKFMGQTGKTGNEVVNVAGSPNDVLINHNVVFAQTIEGSAVLCGTATTGTYEGTTTLKAFNGAGSQVGLTVSGS